MMHAIGNPRRHPMTQRTRGRVPRSRSGDRQETRRRGSNDRTKGMANELQLGGGHATAPPRLRFNCGRRKLWPGTVSASKESHKTRKTPFWRDDRSFGAYSFLNPPLNLRFPNSHANGPVTFSLAIRPSLDSMRIFSIVRDARSSVEYTDNCVYRGWIWVIWDMAEHCIVRERSFGLWDQIICKFRWSVEVCKSVAFLHFSWLGWIFY